MDRGIRPYASSAKTYNEMMDEETEQYYRSRNYNINPSLKQPYTFSSYTEMMYLYSGGEQKSSDESQSMGYENIMPVIVATVTTPDYEFFDYFVEPVESGYLFDEEWKNSFTTGEFILTDNVTGEYWNTTPYNDDPLLFTVSDGAIRVVCGGWNSMGFNVIDAWYKTPTPFELSGNFTIDFSINIGNISASYFKYYTTRIDGSVSIGVLIGTYDGETGVFVYNDFDYIKISTTSIISGVTQSWKFVFTLGDGAYSCEGFLEGESFGTAEISSDVIGNVVNVFCAVESPCSPNYDEINYYTTTQDYIRIY